MRVGLKAALASPRRYTMASAFSNGDCTPSTSSRFLRPASYQARPHSGSRNIGSTDWVLEFAVQHQKGRIARRKFSADLLAVGRGLGVGLRLRHRERRPYRAFRVLELSGADPAVLERRVNIGRVRGRAGHARETIGAVVRRPDGAGFLAELHESSIAQREPRLIEGVELLEDQQRHRLAEIERRLADRAEQVAGIEFGNACADAREIGGGNDDRGLQRAAQAREVHAGVDVRGVRGPDEHGVRGVLRPARQIGGAKIGRVELGSGDLGDAVDAAGAGGCRVPRLSAGQRLARGKAGLLGDRQAATG